MSSILTAKLSSPSQPAAFENAPSLQVTNITETHQGRGMQVATPKGKSTLYCSILVSKKFPEIATLDTALAVALNHLKSRNMDGITGKAFNFEAETEFAKLKPYLNRAIGAVRDRRSNHAVRRGRMFSFDTAEPNGHLRSDLRQFFLTHSKPDRIRVLSNADYNMAVSIFEGGKDFAGVEDTFWNDFLDRAAALIHIRKVGLESGYLLNSTPQNITASGVDHTAVMDAANEAVKAFHSERDLLDLAESYLKTVVAAISLVFGKSFDEIVF